MSTESFAASAAAPPSPGADKAVGKPRAGRLPTLTGMRFPAAFLVFLFHSSLPFPTLRLFADNGTENKFNQIFAQSGAVGVAFFFILSGFVLTWSARPGDTARAFWRRRFVKIVPNYVLAWTLAMVLIFADTKAWQAVTDLFMLQAWVPNVTANFSLDSPSWSLSAEALFYLAFPVLYWLSRRIPDRRLWLATGGTVAAIVLTPIFTYAVLPFGSPGVPNGYTQSVNYYWFNYVFPPTRMLDFLLGILVARAVMSGRWRNIGMLWSSLLLAGAAVAAHYVSFLYGLRAVWVVPAALLIAAGAIADDQGRFTIFRNRAMTWLGEISFAFYLLHFIVLSYTRKELPARLFSTPETIGLMAGELAVSILLAWAMYSLVELPITKAWSRPRRKTPAAPVIPHQRAEV